MTGVNKARKYLSLYTLREKKKRNSIAVTETVPFQNVDLLKEYRPCTIFFLECSKTKTCDRLKRFAV